MTPVVVSSVEPITRHKLLPRCAAADEVCAVNQVTLGVECGV